MQSFPTSLVASPLRIVIAQPAQLHVHTRQIKAAPETKGIPVIALTAHAMAGDEEKALGAGCNDYETKPVDLSKLLAKIGALLQSKSAS